MMNSLRPLVAAALLMAIGTSKAAAQTVMVRHVPAGETVEVFLNATKVATAVVEASGDTSLPLNLRDNNATKTELEANIFIDVCDKVRRVIVVERGQPAATQEPGCDRREISGLYVVSRDKGTYVLAAKPKFEVLAHNKFADDKSIFNGSPAVANGQLFLRSDQYLYCIGKK